MIFIYGLNYLQNSMSYSGVVGQPLATLLGGSL